MPSVLFLSELYKLLRRWLKLWCHSNFGSAGWIQVIKFAKCRHLCYEKCIHAGLPLKNMFTASNIFLFQACWVPLRRYSTYLKSRETPHNQYSLKQRIDTTHFDLIWWSKTRISIMFLPQVLSKHAFCGCHSTSLYRRTVKNLWRCLQYADEQGRTSMLNLRKPLKQNLPSIHCMTTHLTAT